MPIRIKQTQIVATKSAGGGMSTSKAQSRVIEVADEAEAKAATSDDGTKTLPYVVVPDSTALSDVDSETTKAIWADA